MPSPKPQTREEVDAQIEANKAALKARFAELRKASEAENAALRKFGRELDAKTLREQKKRDNHAKILIGIAIIHQCKSSEASATKFKALLADFYADSPKRLEAALAGLTITVKKPGSDQERDEDDTAGIAVRAAVNEKRKRNAAKATTQDALPPADILPEETVQEVLVN
jgi:hypothetical protein